MVEAEKKLIERFYQEFWVFLILFSVLAMITIALIIFCLFKFKKMTIGFKIGSSIFIAMLLGLSSFFGMFFLKYYNDHVYLRTNEPIQVEGKVVDYSIATSGDDLTVTKSWPVILIDETNEEISLNIIKSEEKLQIGGTYEFIYLPNTKIAEVINDTGGAPAS